MVALKGVSDNSDIYECQGDDDREHVALDDDGNDVCDGVNSKGDDCEIKDHDN